MKKFLSLFLMLFIGTVAFAQSADVITEILESPEISYGQACYLSAVYQGFIQDEASFEDAIQVLYDNKQIPEVYYETVSVPLANLCYIFAQMWKTGGGLMYRLTKGAPRYAFKQFKADGIISDSDDPAKLVSGWEALNIYTTCEFTYGKAEVTSAYEGQ